MCIVCSAIVWHPARIVGATFYTRMELGAAKTSYHRTGWQGKLWTTAKTQKGMYFLIILFQKIYQVTCNRRDKLCGVRKMLKSQNNAKLFEIRNFQSSNFFFLLACGYHKKRWRTMMGLLIEWMDGWMESKIDKVIKRKNPKVDVKSLSSLLSRFGVLQNESTFQLIVHQFSTKNSMSGEILSDV